VTWHPPCCTATPGTERPSLGRALKANVAVQHALLVAIWNIATTNTQYHYPGGDYFTRLNPHKARNNAVRQLEAMGYHVTLDQAS
jgi:transposase